MGSAQQRQSGAELPTVRFFARMAQRDDPAVAAEVAVPEARLGVLVEQPATQEPEGTATPATILDGEDTADADDTEDVLDADDAVDAEEPEEVPPGEQIPVTAVDPAEVAQDLANRLAALDRSEMVASGRNLAVVNPRALLTKLQTLSGVLWVAGPLSRPTGWATITTPVEGAVLHGTVSNNNRGKGVGDRLLAEVLAYADEHDYSSITSTVWNDSPGESFVRRHGFEPRPHPSVVRCQDLYATAERRRRISEDTAGYGASYELATSAEELEQGGSTFRVVASHLITGAGVGSAELTVTEGAPEFAVNAMVQVDPRHRGARLGTRMLLDLIAFTQTKATRVRTVQVSSPAADPYITTILDRLGFRVTGVQTEHRLRLR